MRRFGSFDHGSGSVSRVVIIFAFLDWPGLRGCEGRDVFFAEGVRLLMGTLRVDVVERFTLTLSTADGVENAEMVCVISARPVSARCVGVLWWAAVESGHQVNFPLSVHGV